MMRLGLIFSVTGYQIQACFTMASHRFSVASKRVTCPPTDLIKDATKQEQTDYRILNSENSLRISVRIPGVVMKISHIFWPIFGKRVCQI